MKMLRFVAAGRHRPLALWHSDAHSHPFYELVTTYRGMQQTVLNGSETLYAGPGDMFLYCPGVAHEESTTELPHETVWLMFEWDDPPRRIPPSSHDGTGRVRQALTWLHREKDIVTMQSAIARDAYVTAIVAEYMDAATRPSGHDLVRSVRRFVREHIAEDLALADLAREVGMSKFHFLRTYKAFTGLTPMADVRTVRVEYARELIVATDLPLKAVALRAGLGSASFLCRLFRETYDLTPGSLRRHPADE